MNGLNNAMTERPCLYGMDMHAPGWVTEAGEVYFPAGLLGKFRDVVMTWQDRVLMVELKSIDPKTGLGRAALPEGEVWRGPVVQLSPEEKASSYIDAYTLKIKKLSRLPSVKSGHAFWGLDAEERLHSLCVAADGRWIRTNIFGEASYVGQEELSGEKLAERLPVYEPMGLAHTVERIIEGMGQRPPLCRRGRLAWKMHHGTAVMDLALRENTGMLAIEVHLARIGRRTRKQDLMTYLLRENRNLPGFGFSLREQEVVVAMILPVKFIREESTARLLKNLLERCDAYDNHVVKVFQAEWV